jgi:mediator of RNA polymerase II transcription subunit 6
MQMFNPSQGYSTLKTTVKPANRATDSLNTFSRGNTPAPGGRPSSPGAESFVGSTAGSTVRDTLSSIAAERNDDDELLRSLQLSVQYQDDFIDLNPLVGEPGSFKFKETQSRAAAKQREMQARKVLLAAAEKEKTSMLSRQGSMAPTTTPGPSEREKEIVKEKGKERKGSKTPKLAAKGLKRKGSE